jgi:hypothetical protein
VLCRVSAQVAIQLPTQKSNWEASGEEQGTGVELCAKTFTPRKSKATSKYFITAVVNKSN